MVELADTLDLGSSASQHAGSTPVTRTKNLDFSLCANIQGFFFLLITARKKNTSLLDGVLILYFSISSVDFFLSWTTKYKFIF